MEDWLRRSGASGLDGLEVADFPGTGRGVRARQSFKAGERILTIPSSALWTAKGALGDPILGPVLKSVQPPLSVEDMLAVYLLFVRSRETGYEEQRSHIATLPTSYSSSIFFTDDELEVCAGTSLYTLTLQLKKQIEEKYKDLVSQLFTKHRNVFPLDKFSIEDYKWALCTVWSRAMDFAVSEGNSVRVMVPFADMLNHSPHVKQCHAYDPKSGNVSVLAGKDYSIGDQVFINYGPVPNNRLLRLYGFVMPDNPNDSYDLVLQTNPMAPLYEQKERLWTLAGLDSTCTIPLTTKDPLPTSVLRYLRIQRLEEDDFSAMTLQLVNGTDEKLNDANEAQILQFLVESIGAILDSFGVSQEKLKARLASGVYTSGGNAWAAAQVSLGEQRVLKAAQKRAEGLLNSVQNGSLPGSTQCAGCGTDSAPLMCGRCKAVNYCGRPCQVAHFKQHKAACRAKAAAK